MEDMPVHHRDMLKRITCTMLGFNPHLLARPHAIMMSQVRGSEQRKPLPFCYGRRMRQKPNGSHDKEEATISHCHLRMTPYHPGCPVRGAHRGLTA